jgi:hypothetical protein
MPSFDWEKFKFFLKKVIEFKSKTSFIYVNADNWEESIYFALKKMGEEPDWKLGSHAKGRDVKTLKFAISAKSGSIKNDYLTISSYRLTRFETIKEMTNFIKDEINYDFYLCCVRSEFKDGSREYGIYKINSTVFKPNSKDWTEYKSKTGKKAGWECSLKNGVNAKIVINMSNQLWIDIPVNLCKKLFNIHFTKEQIGSNIDDIFK